MSDDATADRQTPAPEEDRPATYREVFASGEYRALFGATLLSWIGDYFTRVAVTVLIFSDTKSVMLAAAAFAISYAPWVAGGPVLAALAERYPYRRVMIAADVGRMLLVGLLAIPGVPLPVLLVLLFCASLLTPPFQAARSAMLPMLLTGDRYVVGLTLQNTVGQFAQVVGYGAGGAVSAVNPRLALAIDAGTFAASALFLWVGVRPRPAAMTEAHRSHLLKETAEGFRVVFGHPVMRPIALVVFVVVATMVVPEGLAAGWAAEMGGGASTTGWLMAANPIGQVVGGVLIGRMLAPSTRLKLVKPLLLSGPVLLLPAFLHPAFGIVFVLVFVTGISGMVVMPLNGLFVQVLPAAYRARAYGIMQAGVQILQGVGVLITGALSEIWPVPTVIGAWALAGLGVLTLATLTWPSREVIAAEIARAKELNADPATS